MVLLRPTLEGPFKLVTDAPAEKRRLDDEMNNIAPTIFYSSACRERFHAIRDEVGACTFRCKACSDAIMVVLNNLLMRFKSDLKLKTTDYNWTKRLPGSPSSAGGNPRDRIR